MRKPGTNQTTKSNVRSAGKSASQQKKGKIPHVSQGTMVKLVAGMPEKPTVRAFSLPIDVSTDASGVLSLAAETYGVANVIGLLGSEFTNYSQEYQQFRPLSLGGRFFPATTNATSTTGPYQTGMILVPWSQARPGGANALYQSRQKVFFSTLEEKEVEVRANFENARLWNSTLVALPADRDFGFAFLNLSNTAVSTRLFTLMFTLVCEFTTAL
jgi:hypothetical protein